jgi:hypothetical protein
MRQQESASEETHPDLLDLGARASATAGNPFASRPCARCNVSIDSYRFLDFASRQVMKAWAAREHADRIPFTPLAKPLGDCTVALLSTAAVARNDDHPFDQAHERRDPWWGDPSYG